MKTLTAPNELQITPEEIKALNNLRRMPPKLREVAAAIIAKMAENHAGKRPSFQLINGGRSS